jgi:intergrase/recombinase
LRGVNSYNLIIKLSREGRLDEYYQKEKEVLEHFRFKELFIRRSKKAFVSFAPAELIQRIQENSPLTSADAVQKLVQKKGLHLRFADIRETHATFMIKHLQRKRLIFCMVE